MGFSFKRALGGGLTGAVQGFAAGGPKGALIGAGAGAVLGGMGGLPGVAAPSDRVGEFESGIDPELRRLQLGQIQQLQNRANGIGTFASDQLAASAMDRGRNMLMSQAASGRSSGGVGQRNAMVQGGLLASRIAGQQMASRIQEQEAARQQLGAMTNTAMEQNLGNAQTRVGYQGVKAGLATQQEGFQNMLATTLPMLGKAFGKQTPGSA